MRFAGSLIFGLLAVNGLAQTVDSGTEAEPSAIAEPQPSAPAAEPSSPAQQPQPSDPASDQDTKPTDAEQQPSAEQPSATAAEPQPTEKPSQVSEGEQPSATASNDDENASTAPEATATADASATDDEASATATETGDDASDTATATATSSSAPTSTAAVVEVNLKNATIGDNAELVKVDGKPAIKLSAPANGQATFSVAVDTKDDDFSTDELIYIVASILVGEPSGSAKLRRRDTKTDCTLQIQANGQSVYNEPLYSNNGKFSDVTSSGIESSDKPEVQVTQKCGDKPSPLTVNNVRVGNANAIRSSSESGGSGGSGNGGSGSGSGGSGGKGGSGTSTATGASSSATGDSGNLGTKAKASVGALAAAVLAAAALI